MAIIHTRPPNYAQILAVFPGAAAPKVIFAYHPNIHVPCGQKLPQALLAHEMVHIHRQELVGVEKWWDDYLIMPAFRYQEELLAHRQEYVTMISGMAPNRNMRRSALKIVAKKLAATLYGNMVSPKQAAEDIMEGIA